MVTPFPLIDCILGKVLTEHTYLILVMTWQAQSLYPRLKNPLFLPKMPGLLVGRNRENFYLIERRNFWHGQFLEKLSSERISEDSISHITCGTRQDTNSHYKLPQR